MMRKMERMFEKQPITADTDISVEEAMNLCGRKNPESNLEILTEWLAFD